MLNLMATVSLNEWNQLSDAVAVRMLTELTRELPPGFDFCGLHQNELGGLRHRLGEFDFDGARFSSETGAIAQAHLPYPLPPMGGEMCRHVY